MKNKTYWIICVICITLGSILLFTGIFLGGSTSFSYNSNGFIFNSNNFLIYETFESYETSSTLIEEYDGENLENIIDTIILNSNLADITVIHSSSIGIDNYSNQEVSYEFKDNILIIDANYEYQNTFGFQFNKLNSNKIIITIPSFIKQLDVSTSGKININDIEIDSLTLDTNLGEISISNSSIDNLTTISNLGSVNIYDCDINTLEADLDLGIINLDKSYINKEAIINASMGSIELDLLDKQNDYNIYSNIDLGSIKINDSTVINTGNGHINLHLNTKLGSIKIYTK